jgi:hypothetical protein
VLQEEETKKGAKIESFQLPALLLDFSSKKELAFESTEVSAAIPWLKRGRRLGVDRQSQKKRVKTNIFSQCLS